ncbi:dihydroorotase [Oceanibacterium hippocampi]|uniref:Dihydroorotase n=1 Tax=Oceanibacterium hippocampi TaxID=745714 RepID=A0A1Y5SSK2_9PROT|nr:dihydroorotase [Oceanibacterium hippocampi]SLN44202.1 Dihydroorotase [Oceanibacterium hippocampi]
MSEFRRTAYVNARLLDPESGLDDFGSLLTEGRKIRALGPEIFADGTPEDALVVDCGGRCLAPGLIDMHAELGEPGAEYRETVRSAGAAAAAGGVTTIVALPNTEPVIDDPAMVEFVFRRVRAVSPVRVHQMGALTKGLRGEELAEIGLLAEAGAIAFTDAPHPVARPTVMRRALAYAGAFDALIIAHVEDPDLAADGAMNEGEMASLLGLSGNPSVAETIMVERDLRLVELTGGRWHAAQLTTAESIEALRRGKYRGLDVSAGTAPHYFTLNELAVGDYRTYAKVSPPLRDEMDRRAVVLGLQDGTIEIISSQHSPQDVESKRLPFGLASPGVIGLETLLPVSLGLYHNGHMSLLDVLAKMTINPARLLGLEQGRLAPGASADLAIFDPDTPWRIDGEKLRSKCANTAFDGLMVQGRVWRTVVGGETVFDATGEDDDNA